MWIQKNLKKWIHLKIDHKYQCKVQHQIKYSVNLGQLNQLQELNKIDKI
jgi:hypothetical protein